MPGNELFHHHEEQPHLDIPAPYEVKISSDQFALIDDYRKRLMQDAEMVNTLTNIPGENGQFTSRRGETVMNNAAIELSKTATRVSGITSKLREHNRVALVNIETLPTGVDTFTAIREITGESMAMVTTEDVTDILSVLYPKSEEKLVQSILKESVKGAPLVLQQNSMNEITDINLNQYQVKNERVRTDFQIGVPNAISLELNSIIKDPVVKKFIEQRRTHERALAERIWEELDSQKVTSEAGNKEINETNRNK